MVILFRKFPRKLNTISGKLLGRNKKKALPLAVAAETMPLELAENKPAQAWTQHGPGRRSPVHFSEICLTWFVAESGFRIEIWTRQYRQIVQNFDPRLMELALEAPDIIEKSKTNEMFQT